MAFDFLVPVTIRHWRIVNYYHHNLLEKIFISTTQKKGLPVLANASLHYWESRNLEML